jgi:hypothetical protein
MSEIACDINVFLGQYDTVLPDPSVKLYLLTEFFADMSFRVFGAISDDDHSAGSLIFFISA